MSGLIGLLSDAHGNSFAFEKAVKLLRSKGATKLYFLGDAVGYIPSTGVLDTIRQLGNNIECIKGNHEVMLIAGIDDAKRESVYLLNYLRGKLENSQLQMIKLWPKQLTVFINGLKIMLIHGSPDDTTFGYVYPETDLSQFDVNANVVFMANTHRPFISMIEHQLFVNIGSCGLPRDDGRYGSVALFDPISLNVRILRFDISEESKMMFEQSPEIHDSVRRLFDRRDDSMFGFVV